MQRRRQLWLSGGLVAAIVLLVPWLPELVLTERETWPRAEVFIPWGGDMALDEAWVWQRASRAQLILLCEMYAWRNERLGIVPREHELQQQALIARGVPAEAIALAAGNAATDWQQAEAYGAWLQARPDDRAQVYCAPFDARRIARLLRARLPKSVWLRVRVCGVEDEELGPGRWWRSRRGWKTGFSSTLVALYDAVASEPPPKESAGDIEALERSLP